MLPHGLCAFVALDDHEIDEALAGLPLDEQALVLGCPEGRRREKLGGRVALHRALVQADAERANVAIGADDRGAPVLPAPWCGSVSHKGDHAVALVASSSAARVGIDLERATPPRQDIAARILTDRERAALGAAASRTAEVTLRFSIKEAIYKAIDPFVRRYVEFTEVELDVRDDGTVRVTTALPLEIEAQWRRHEAFWLTTALARRR